MKREHSRFDILKRILDERQKRNWSEYTLARNSGITQSTISTWYKRNLQPSVASIEKICNAYGISLSEFFAESDMEIIEDSFDNLNNIDNHTQQLPTITPEKKELLRTWGSLSSAQRHAVILLMQSMIDE